MQGRILLAQGREAEVFLLADGTVLKLLRDAEDGELATREFAAMRALRAMGDRVPAVLGEVMVDGRPGIVMERVSGTDLLSTLGRRPWSIVRAGRSIGRVHAAVHGVTAPAGLPDLRVALQDRIARAPLAPRVVEACLAVLDACPDGDRLCHGDLHFGNLLGSWTSPVVIDWGGAARGDPCADVARTKLLLGVGEPPAGAPIAIRLLAPLVRAKVVRAYVAAYARHRPIDRQSLARWDVVQAAARLCEEMSTERSHLLGLLEARLGIST